VRQSFVLLLVEFCQRECIKISTPEQDHPLLENRMAETNDGIYKYSLIAYLLMANGITFLASDPAHFLPDQLIYASGGFPHIGMSNGFIV
jgi:hypothetical protein